MGAVLSQRQEDGRLHPIAYMSQSFTGAEHNYDMLEVQAYGHFVSIIFMLMSCCYSVTHVHSNFPQGSFSSKLLCFLPLHTAKFNMTRMTRNF
jgi:hypothetical protein